MASSTCASGLTARMENGATCGWFASAAEYIILFIEWRAASSAIVMGCLNECCEGERGLCAISTASAAGPFEDGFAVVENMKLGRVEALPVQQEYDRNDPRVNDAPSIKDYNI
jgi:hypothetical protein